MILEPLDLALARDTTQLRHFRTTLGDWLDRGGVNGDDRDEIILAAHEAAANGMEHCDGDGEIRVQAEMDAQAVTIMVTSPGPWREPKPRFGRGNGLVLIRGLTEAEIDATATSVKVRLSRRLSTAR
jgi:anti-sigma regulatory factor (Ser/Thr protein kinase)